MVTKTSPNRTQAEADAILAEFLVKGGHIVKYRGKKASTKAEKRDAIEKAEFQPDNSRIGCQSRGMQSRIESRIPMMFVMGLSLDVIAKAMVAEYSDWCQGSIRKSTVVTVESKPEPVEAMPIYTCATAPAYIGTRDEYQTPEPIRIHKAEKDNISWKTTRKPTQGQRPTVLLAQR